MERNEAATVSARIWATSGLLARRLLLTGVFVGALAFAAHIKIPLPFTPVPLTLQTLVVLLAGGLLGLSWGLAATSLYLLLSLAGLPVTAGPTFWGPTGGYLLGFVCGAAIMGWAAQDLRNDRRLMLGVGAASLLILLCGCLWLSAYTGTALRIVIQQGALPFLPGDALKAGAAWLLLKRFGPAVRCWLSL